MDNSNNSNSSNPLGGSNQNPFGSSTPPTTPPFPTQLDPTTPSNPAPWSPAPPPPPTDPSLSASPFPAPATPEPSFAAPPPPVEPAAAPVTNFTPSPSTTFGNQPDFSAPPSPFGAPPPADPVLTDQPTGWPPTPTPIESGPTPSQPAEAPNLSPLDNPWGAPVQTPSIDGLSQNPTPTFTATPPAESVQPSWAPSSTPEPEPVTQADAAPTDLSHLISNNNNNLENPTQVAPETLVVPSTPAAGPEVSVPTETHRGIPKWVIGVGIGLILIVAAASAYFILGVGQPTGTTSLPATVSDNTAPAKTPAPTPIATTTPVATGSANFGDIEGNTGTTQTATSAADLIRQRQQGQ